MKRAGRAREVFSSSKTRQSVGRKGNASYRHAKAVGSAFRFAEAESALVCRMLIPDKIVDAINEQIGYEFSASLQYYAIGAHFAAEALPQLSEHFFKQAEEEKG